VFRKLSDLTSAGGDLAPAIKAYRKGVAKLISLDTALAITHPAKISRAKDHSDACASRMGRFETQILTQPQNPKALMNQPGQYADAVYRRKTS